MDSTSLTLGEFLADIALLLFALFLVLLNGFFVAAEFALVRLRATKLDALAREHGWRGRILRTVHKQMDAYLSACQLGITLASLGLGWVGEPAFAELLRPLLGWIGVESPAAISAISLFVAFALISYLHIVLGELAPKSWAIRQPERLSLWTAAPLYGFYWLMYPAIYLLNASANGLLRIAGQGSRPEMNDTRYSLDELKLILSANVDAQQNPDDFRVLASAAELGELEVVDWANSREDLICLPLNASLKQVYSVLRRYKYSRYPLKEPKSGHLVGILHIKDLLLHLARGADPAELELEDLMRPLERVSRHYPLTQLLEQFRRGGAHFAVVEEADGKVVGFLTMEDILEALLGDIQDEHRKPERGVLVYQPGKLLVRGDTPLAKLERLLRVNLDHLEPETLAGLIYEHLKRMPQEDEVIETEGLRIVIKKMKGPKVLLAKVLKLPAAKKRH